MIRPPSPWSRMCRHGGPDAGERAAQVDLEHCVELLVGHLPQHAVAQDAGVGDEDVEPSVLRDGPLDKLARPSRCDPTAPGSATAAPPVAEIFSATSCAASRRRR